jgi:hypothetical protein
MAKEQTGKEPPAMAPYFLFNLFVGAAFLVIVGYFALTPLFGLPAIQCMHKGATGMNCPSCGLTRSIWALLQGDTGKALRVHAGGLWIGGFFAGQLLLRGVSLTAAYYHQDFAEKTLWKIDAAVSVLLVIVCFGKGYSLI